MYDGASIWNSIPQYIRKVNRFHVLKEKSLLLPFEIT